MKKKILRDVFCAHNVSFSGYAGSGMRAIVFTNPSVINETYIWITTAGCEFVEGQYYNIVGECDTRGILKRVKQIEPPVKSTKPTKSHKSHLKVDVNEEIINSWNAQVISEQPDSKTKHPVDVFDLIYGTDTPLTND